VVLSFAGEDRKYVEQVAELLNVNDVPLFYDDYEEAWLWGKNLTEHLHTVYGGSARFCVMFISKHYAEKPLAHRRVRQCIGFSIDLPRDVGYGENDRVGQLAANPV
jgi:hypothetical protein